MSERVFKFLLSELTKVRVICPAPRCGAVVELSLDQLAARFTGRIPACPVCNHEFTGTGPSPLQDLHQQNAFFRLANAILDIQGEGKANKPDVQIEFVLPDTTDK